MHEGYHPQSVWGPRCNSANPFAIPGGNPAAAFPADPRPHNLDPFTYTGEGPLKTAGLNPEGVSPLGCKEQASPALPSTDEFAGPPQPGQSIPGFS